MLPQDVSGKRASGIALVASVGRMVLGRP
ncbi:hypothetical protein L195_g063367, partial [Trifolium pratense]